MSQHSAEVETGTDSRPGGRGDVALVVSDATLDEVTAEIRKQTRDATIGLAIRIGEIIVTRCYGGDLEATRRRGADVCLRSLAERLQASGEADGAGQSYTQLYRCIRLYEMAKNGLPIEGYTPAFVRPLIGLPVDQQRELLAKAGENQWSRAQMEEAASELRENIREAKGEERRGRRPDPAFLKTLRAFGKYLDREGAFGDLDEIPELSPEDAETAFTIAVATRKKCEELERALREQMRGRPER